MDVEAASVVTFEDFNVVSIFKTSRQMRIDNMDKISDNEYDLDSNIGTF